MSRLPRLAIGTVQVGADASLLMWALLDALDRMGLRVQSFLSRACFVPRDGAMVITGLCPRHLDSWLMSPDMCRQVLLQAADSYDLAVIEGQPAAGGAADACGGNLETLCRWLDLPQLAVVDASRLRGCSLPECPAGVQGILLDNVVDSARYFRLQTSLECLWGIPVLGGLRTMPEARAAARQLPPGTKPPRELCRALGDSFCDLAQLDRIWRIAQQRDFPYRTIGPALRPGGSPLRVAVAFDEAFNCYFPATLDLLEARGATVTDFSPLRDERLPSGSDIVYIGCGHPERFAHELIENNCMMSALREHLCNGRRIYAEGGGLAYLCQHVELADGQRLPMVGGLPAIACMNPHPAPPRPTEVTLAVDTWLGKAGSRLRGYVNSNWIVEPTSAARRYLQNQGHDWDLIGRHQAIGSRLHLNFSAQPQALDRFFERHAAVLDVAPRPMASSL